MLYHKLIYNRFAMVCVGTGGGKTYIGLHTAALMDKDAHIIVFAPKKKIVERDWEKSLASYNEVMGTNLIMDTFNYDLCVHEQHFKRIKQIIHEYTLKRCKEKRRVILILDEAHRIKDPTSSTARGILKLSNMSPVLRTIGLTATPLGNSYMDAVGYFVLAGFYSSKTEFNRIHVKYHDQYGAPVVKDHSGRISRDYFNHPHMIEHFIERIMLNIDLEHLKPNVTVMERHFQLTPEQRKGYNQIKKDYRNGLYENIQQATKALREYLAEHSEAKHYELSNILNNSFITRPVLIFYQYNVELESLEHYLETHHRDFDIIKINGHTKVKQEDLLEPKNPRTIFLIQYRAGSEGLDAKWSNVSIFYAPTHFYINFKQARGRNVRAWQKTGDVYHFRFIVDNTLESEIWRALNNKEDFSESIMASILYDIDDDEKDATQKAAP